MEGLKDGERDDQHANEAASGRFSGENDRRDPGERGRKGDGARQIGR